MNADRENRIRKIMSGEARGIGPALLRSALAMAEPFYTWGVRKRNRSFDTGGRPVKSLPRPVVSIGNVTTGGTGKTPTVRWLAERLRDEGKHVAILSRGYKSAGAGPGDELTMLDQAMNAPGKLQVAVRANPDRFTAGSQLLEQLPQTNVFILDDGFQHRKLARNLDVVLINAAEPFGFGHVLPRGMLREPLAGLRRAHAIAITHSDQVSTQTLLSVEAQLRQYHPTVPIYRTCHRAVGLIQGTERRPMDELGHEPFFAFCGIGSPAGFDAQLARFGPNYKGHHWFADHHRYRLADLNLVAHLAAEVGAGRLVTTEKDWVKVEPLLSGFPLSVARVEIELQFERDDEKKLLDQVRLAIGS